MAAGTETHGWRAGWLLLFFLLAVALVLLVLPSVGIPGSHGSLLP